MIAIIASLVVTTHLVHTAPAGDGQLCGQEKDGIMVECPAPDGGGFHMLAGNIWKRTYKSVMEFAIPDEVLSAGSNAVVAAEVGACAFTAPGCYESRPGAGGPTLELHAYHSPAANGMVELTDDRCGRKLPRPVLSAGSRLAARAGFSADVTEAVREAVRRRDDFIGFRLESPDPSGSAWSFQTSDNPWDNPKSSSRPFLKIKVNKGK